jgi:hypothetical protein
MRLSRNRLEESRAPRPGRTQHDEHLSRLDQTIQGLQDLDLAALVAHQLPRKAGALEPNVAHALLVVGVGAEAMDVEVPESDTGSAHRRRVGVLELRLQHGLCPGAGVEVLASGVQRRSCSGVERVLPCCRRSALLCVPAGECMHGRVPPLGAFCFRHGFGVLCGGEGRVLDVSAEGVVVCVVRVVARLLGHGRVVRGVVAYVLGGGDGAGRGDAIVGSLAVAVGREVAHQAHLGGPLWSTAAAVPNSCRGWWPRSRRLVRQEKRH